MDNYSQNTLSKFYGDSFYVDQMDGSYRSAQKYAAFLCSYYKPSSVVDLGCGRGTWLKAFKENGTHRVVGLDGIWNNQSNMIDQTISFYSVDLNNHIALPSNERFDLAVSLEVAEHLEATSASIFVDSLCELADVVLFGAAYVSQGGINHINEQQQTYWAEKFIENDYVIFDLFRSKFWGDTDVEYWYQQNAFLYVKNMSEAMNTLTQQGLKPLSNTAFMNCVHPTLYNLKRTQPDLTTDDALRYAEALILHHPEYIPKIEQLLTLAAQKHS